MTPAVSTALLIVFALVVAVAPSAAHHSIAAEFDHQQPLTLTGKVTRIEWMNPHIYFYVVARDETGRPMPFAIQGAAPNTLYRLGWKKDSLKLGDLVTVYGYKARDGWNRLSARNVTLSDGRKVFASIADLAPN